MDEMTDEIRRELHTNEAFRHVIERCLDEQELITGFCRIYEVELPRQPRYGLEAMIDEATGYRQDTYFKFFAAFIPFVYRAIYLPLKAEFERDSRSEKGGKNKKGGF
ncbi:hypothetical protein QM327_16745 [Pantoea dispersa]|uniref:hypothetical protein n=1 Tax=Pantoea dispersa TaxID=59814 RepID=UPI0024B64104|nr:hypothetical protein [Pantoea dispersa]MDI9768202.1 hypothetical protein [Pantoea dispersa]